MKYKNIKGFTIIELIVVISIIAILTTISFVSYLWYLSTSRDATRKSDVWKIKETLNDYKAIIWKYPVPENYLLISNSWASNQIWITNIYVEQWILKDKFDVSRSFTMPKDPKNAANYFYSVTSPGYHFQIWLTLENWWKNIAYVDGNYKNTTKDIFPSLLLAVSWSWNTFEVHSWTSDWSANRQKFIVNWWSYNLPYNFTDGSVVASWSSYDTVVNESSVNIWTWTSFWSCSEIYENGKYLWPWLYGSTSWIIDCTNWDCAVKPTYVDAVFDTWSSSLPQAFDTAWQNVTSTWACYYHCGNWRTTQDCN